MALKASERKFYPLGQLIGFAFHLAKMNLDKLTIYNRTKSIERLTKNGAGLGNPDSVLSVLALGERWSQGTKANLLQAYKSYAKYMKISIDVEFPHFKSGMRQPRVAKETLLDQLIAGSGWKTGAFLQLLKESGARTVEASRLQWQDIDATNQTITISKAAKNGRPRQIQVTEKLIQMLERQPRVSDFVFGKSPESIRKRMRANFHWARAHIAAKTADKELLRAHLHTFRHFYATKLYLQTSDIRYVQKKLGHRSITSTTIYENSEPCMDVKTYISKVATTDDEKLKLVNLEYEYTGV